MVIIKVEEKEYRSDDSNNIVVPVYVNTNEIFQAECYAINARPTVSLTWTVNGQVVNAETSYTESTHLRGKYTYTNTTSELGVGLEEDHGLIACSSSLRNETGSYQLHISVTLPYITYGKTALCVYGRLID